VIEVDLHQPHDGQPAFSALVSTLDRIVSLTVLPIDGGRLPLLLSVEGLTSRRLDGTKHVRPRVPLFPANFGTEVRYLEIYISVSCLAVLVRGPLGSGEVHFPRPTQHILLSKCAGGLRDIGSSGRGVGVILHATRTLIGGVPTEVDVAAGDSWRGM